LQAQATLPDYYGEACKESIGFWENRGQIKNQQGLPVPNVMFYSQGAYPRAYFQKESRFSLVLQQPTSMDPNTPLISHRLDVRPYDAHNVTPTANIVKTHYQNFYLPWCGATGVTNVHGFDWVTYPNVYDAIDMVFYSGSAGQKLAFFCWPGSDPDKIALQFFGQDSVRVDVAGHLRIFKNGVWIKLDEAVAYQVGTNNQVIPLAWSAEYVNNNGDDVVELAFDTYDPELPLILQIGPTPLEASTPADGLCWSTLLGGSERDEVVASTVDDAANFYVTGYSYSSFLTFQDNVGTVLLESYSSVLLGKFGASHDLRWTVFYGGSDEQSGEAVVVKGAPAMVYVSGWTYADDLWAYPQTGAYNDQSGALLGGGFIAKFDAFGFPVWSTYFGDVGERINGMDEDAYGRLYVVGECNATYPAMAAGGASSWTHAGGQDLLLARFNENDALEWCTAFGGSATDRGSDVRCYSDGLYISGSTSSTNIPLVSGGSSSYNQTTNAGGTDNTMLKFSMAGSCQWATYLGGNGSDEPAMNSLAVEPTGTVYLGGLTSSTNLPLVNAGGFYSNVSSVAGSGYLCKFNGANRALSWSTYLGGPERSGIHGLELAADKLFAVGYINGEFIPIQTQGGLYSQSTIVGGDPGFSGSDGLDGVILGFEPSTALSYSSFFGGDQGGNGEGIRTASYKGGILMLGGITSKGFPASSVFPFYDPSDPAYFDEDYDQDPLNYKDIFMTALCVGAYTNQVGITDLVQTSADLRMIPLGRQQFQLQGLPEGINTIQVMDSRGRLLNEVQRTIAPNGAAIIDLAGQSAATYVIRALSKGMVLAGKLIVTD